MRLATIKNEEKVYHKDSIDAADSLDKAPDILDIVGLALLLFFSLFSMAAMLLAGLSLFTPPLLIASSLAISLAIGFSFWQRFRTDLSVKILGPTVGAFAVMALSAGLFTPPAQFILGGWDAGVYYNTGIALAESGSLTWKDELFESLPPEVRNTLVDSRPQLYEYLLPGFFISEGADIKSQFPMLLSVWIGVLALVGGNHLALFTPSILSGLAIFWFYTFSRHILGSKFAFMASVLLATNTVQIWHARQTLSEVTLQGMIFGSLAVALLFLRYGSPHAAVSAGLGLGILPLIKTEATFVSIIFILFFAVATVRMGKQLRWPLGGFTAGMLFSAGYYLTVARMYVFEQVVASGLYLAMGSILVAGAILSIAILGRGRLPSITRKARALGIISAICLSTVGFAGLTFANKGIPDLIGLSVALWDGLFLSPLDGLFIFLGIYFVFKAKLHLQGPGMAVIILLMAAFMASLLYLAIYINYFRAKEEIPLFFWATRRLVPLVIPLISLLIAFSFFQTSQLLKGYNSNVFASFAMVAVLLFRLPDMLPVMRHTEYEGSIEQVGRIARSIEGNSIVLFDTDDLGQRLSTPLRFMHGLPSYVMRNSDASIGTLFEMARESGKSVIYVASGPGASSAYFNDYTLALQDSFELALPEWEMTSEGRPSKAYSFSTPVYIFKVRAGASHSPVPMPLRINVGSNSAEEYQHLSGDLFLAETTPAGESYRWTGRQIKIAAPKIEYGPLIIEFMAAGSRPEGVPGALLEVSCGTRNLRGITLLYNFSAYRFEVPPDCNGEAVTITTNTWTPKDYAISADNRALGFMLAWLELKRPIGAD